MVMPVTIRSGVGPGASVPATRALIEERWLGARLYDHYGMTEAGPVTLQCAADCSVVHALEEFHICEVIDRKSGEPLPMDSDDLGELVVTNLGRIGSPILRYRTGDLVRPHREPCACGRDNLSFEGGIQARADDMVVVRGVNLYPAAVDQIVRSQTGVEEYRVRTRTERGMTEVEVEIEPSPEVDATALCDDIQDAFRTTCNLRFPVSAVAPGSLPRFDLKAQRWVRE